MFEPVYERSDLTSQLGGQVASIAGMFVMPSMFPVTRLKDQYNSAATAVMNPFIYEKENWVPQSSQPGQLVSTDWGAFFFRNMLRSKVHYIQTTSNSTPSFTYIATFNPLSGAPEAQLLQSQIQTPLLPIYFSQATPNQVKAHGQYLYCGKFDGLNGFWVDALAAFTATITVTLSATPSSTIQGVLYQYQVARWEPVQTGVNNITTSITFSNIQQSGYYAIAIDSTAALTAQISVSQLNFTVTSPAIWAHEPTNATNSAANNIEGYRVLAFDTLISDEASDLTNQGDIVAAQLNQATDWYQTYAQGNLFYNISNLMQMDIGKLKNGLFFFIKPTGTKTFKFHSDFKKAGSATQLSDSTYPLQTPDDYMGVAASCVNPQGGDLLCKTRYAIEFKSSSTEYTYLPPDANSEAMELAMNAVGTMVQFYENPTHWMDILKTLNQKGSASEKAVAMLKPWLAGDLGGAGDIAGQALAGIAKGAEMFTGPNLQQQAAGDDNPNPMGPLMGLAGQAMQWLL